MMPTFGKIKTAVKAISRWKTTAEIQQIMQQIASEISALSRQRIWQDLCMMRENIRKNFRII